LDAIVLEQAYSFLVEVGDSSDFDFLLAFYCILAFSLFFWEWLWWLNLLLSKTVIK
jgi:hypothetical protein